MNRNNPQLPSYGPSISLGQAPKASAAAQTEALRNGWRMVVAIMDVGGAVIGGIGISGGTSAQDGQVAEVGLNALAS